MLVATSIATLGVVFPDVKHVINYDLPQYIEEYVHRIGRTGRFGSKVMATAFFRSDRDGALARGLVKVLADVRREGRREGDGLERGEREREREREEGREGGWGKEEVCE